MKHGKIKKTFIDAFSKPESDDIFAFIAGYTEGGFPYGITWDELQSSGFVDNEIAHQGDDSLF